MPKTAKKVLIWVFWIFVVYALFTSPDQVATIIRNAWNTIVTALTSLGIFFDRVMGR